MKQLLLNVGQDKYECKDEVYGEGSVRSSTHQEWFAKFMKDEVVLKDNPHRSRSQEFGSYDSIMDATQTNL